MFICIVCRTHLMFVGGGSWEWLIGVMTFRTGSGCCWSLICLAEREVGVGWRNNRRFINAIFRVLRTGAPWRDLPPDCGDWNNTHRRFCRWRDKGLWGALPERLVDEPDDEWLMIDASHLKVHPPASGAVGGNQAMGRAKGG